MVMRSFKGSCIDNAPTAKRFSRWTLSGSAPCDKPMAHLLSGNSLGAVPAAPTGLFKAEGVIRPQATEGAVMFKYLHDEYGL